MQDICDPIATKEKDFVYTFKEYHAFECLFRSVLRIGLKSFKDP